MHRPGRLFGRPCIGSGAITVLDHESFMKLYTKTGDTGETSLFDGTRVPKNEARVASYGEVDELNALLGWCRVVAQASAVNDPLAVIQRRLFRMGAELATPAEMRQLAKMVLIEEIDCVQLEGWIDEAVAACSELKNFILPGGSELASRLHITRTVCRRVERDIVALARQTEVRPELIIYLNRLGDLLFAWARLANHEAGVDDVIWKSSD
jgi:cob(I)alamin adenosyltransferase